MNLEPAPRLPKWIFLAIDAGLLITAFLITYFAKDPYAPLPFVSAVICVALASIIGLIPFLIDYAADSAEYVQQEREKVAEQVQRLHAAGESLMRAAAQIKAVEEAAQKTAHAAEHLPYRMQEKLAEFNQQLAQADDDEKERLTEELTTLRQSESERLQAITDKIHKAAADWAALEVATRKQLTTAQEISADKFDDRVAAAIESLEAKVNAVAGSLDDKVAAGAATLDARMSTVMAALDAKLATFAAIVAAANPPASATPAQAPEQAVVPASAPETKRARHEKKRAEPAIVETPNSPEPAPEPKSVAAPEAAPEPAAPAVEAIAEPTPVEPAAEPAPAVATVAEAEPIAETATEFAPAAAPVESVVEPVPAIAEVTPERDPRPEPVAPTAEAKPKKAHSSRKAKPEETLGAMSAEPVLETARAAASETSAPIAPDDFFQEEPAPHAPAQATATAESSGELFDEPAEKPEPAASSDGATRLLATAYIGIGNKLFIRGEGPGLSWDKGVAMQFVSIGKWGWASHDATVPIRAKLYKNDELAALSGEVTLLPGKHVEVTALF